MYKINQFVNGPGPPMYSVSLYISKNTVLHYVKRRTTNFVKKLRMREENTNLTDMLLCHFWCQILAAKGGHHACLVIAAAGVGHAGHGPLLQKRWGEATRPCAPPLLQSLYNGGRTGRHGRSAPRTAQEQGTGKQHGVRQSAGLPPRGR
jgi:hypothetical protein